MTRSRGGACGRAADCSHVQARRGPHTPGGKARVAQNAVRYGLSLPVLADPATAAEVQALMRQLCSTADAETNELARAVAQAQVDLIRIRRVRQGLIAAVFSHVADGPEKAVIGPGAAPFRLPDLVVQLAATDRYERRALSRRKFAMRRQGPTPAVAQ
jgi:hypothetical protein